MKMNEIKQLKMTRMLRAKKFLEKGYSIKKVAEKLKLSVSTIQAYNREIQNQLDYPVLRKLLTIANYSKGMNLRKVVETMRYSDICCVCRNEKITGKTKRDKIEGIIALFRWINFISTRITSEA